MKKLCVRPAESKADLCIKEDESSVSSLLLSLTQDLQSMIYAKLPLQDLYKLRTCCRELYDVIHHDSFKNAAQVVAKSSCDLVRSSSAYYSPMFFSVGHDGVLEWAGYDVTSSKWSTLPSLNRLPSPDPGLLKEFLIAGDDGLLCINVAKVSLEAAAAPKLVIYNPLTQQIRELPPMNFPRHPVLMHVLVDKCRKNSYKVIVAGSSSTGTEHLSRKTEVYCSETQSWQVSGDLPGPDFGLNEYQNGAYCDGVLYCVALSTDDHVMHSSVSGCKVVLAYHVKKGKWLTNWYCPIPSFRSHAYFATTQIVALAGSIFVFSEQEYLKEVKFCIARLDCIEMGMGSQKKNFHMMEHQQQPPPMSCKWYNNNNNKSISKPQIVPQELLLQSEAPGRVSGILYGNSEGRNSGIPFGNSEPAPIVTHENFITKKHEEENLLMWSNVMNFRKFSEMGSKDHEEEEEEELMWQRIQKERKEGKWEIVLEESKNGSRGLLVYPENTCVAQETISTSEKKHNLCIFNTVERTMIILDDFQNNNNNIHNHNHNNDNHKNSNTTSSYPIHNPIKLRENKKKFHSLNPLGFAFKPNFSASV